MQSPNITASQAGPTTTVLSLLERASGHLARLGFDEARLTVELMLAHVLALRRLDLYLQFDRRLTNDELEAFRGLYRRRTSREPLPYILGETEFMGLRLEVNNSVLIPRPETELLVEAALRAASRLGRRDVEILDAGTGSGNIAVALALRLPGARITAVDVSDDALATAERNTRRHGVHSVRLMRRDILEDAAGDPLYDMIVSNPPYISAAEFETLQEEIRRFEPRIATTDGGDGLLFFRRISVYAARQLASGGALLMEMGFGQSSAVTRIVEKAGLVDVEVFPDHAGIPRVVQARRVGP